ncbi:hypothetical protein J2X12_002849 [Pseudarthrobacter oxydans]|uniref:Uncharacterized protein n=1 Tax=Pseudarthrobacter oxydans TaxID=1671 RepID=A0AAW8NCQ1_PSEOX|nr:hypothetical protein [Pseudarthrobacter oxydans]MDR6794838.1 hypothetical protein [Pseudarthrobacter oxydans]MDR7164811.1 hypothetical protein [Pseudarthrobacter oxydans]
MSDQAKGAMMSDCEAETRITQALFELEIGWGAGVFDYGKIKSILIGGSHEECRHEREQ